MSRWGVATIVNGQVAGVSGSFRLRRIAEREARRRRDVINLDENPVDGYRVVRRSSARSGDWGVRPDRSIDLTTEADVDAHEAVDAREAVDGDHAIKPVIRP